MAKEQKNKFYLNAAAWKTGLYIGGIGIQEKAFEKNDIFLKEFTNFGRLDNTSKAVCSVVAVLLKHLNLYPSEQKKSIPIFFSNPKGTLYSDSKYFLDFLEFGQVSGRANLFIYSLPTSPLGEVSVHFGLTGSISYINSSNTLKSICEIIMNSVDEYKEGVLIGIAESDKENCDALFLYIQAGKVNLPSLEEISEFEYNSVREFKEKILNI